MGYLYRFSFIEFPETIASDLLSNKLATPSSEEFHNYNMVIE